jgi:glycosyltransferase involved in cell wall biosynthesis
MGNIFYLCLDVTRQGQASFAHVHEIIKGLQTRGWKVRLFEPSYVSSPSSPGALTRFLEFIRVQVKMWCTRPKPDILYVRTHFAAFPSSLWAKMVGIPVLCEVNGPYEDLFSAWAWTRKLATVFKFLTWTQLRLAATISAVTPGLKAWVKGEVGDSLVHVIPNGANTDIFHPKAQTAIKLPEHYAVFFGSFAAWQGIETILAAVKLSIWPDSLKVVFLGDGVLKPKVDMASRSCEKVAYLGTVPYDSVPGVVAGSIGGLVPKTNMGGNVQTGLFPLKLFETLACGVPVIVTDFPGQSDVVRQHDCGLVIPPEDPQALATAVTYLYEHPEARSGMGNRGREFVAKEASWDRRAGETSLLLELMIKSKP